MADDDQGTVTGAKMGLAARCGGCGREWWLIHTDDMPVRMPFAIRAMRNASCPACGNTGKRKHEPKIYWLNQPPRPAWMQQQQQRAS